MEIRMEMGLATAEPLAWHPVAGYEQRMARIPIIYVSKSTGARRTANFIIFIQYERVCAHYMCLMTHISLYKLLALADSNNDTRNPSFIALCSENSCLNYSV